MFESSLEALHGGSVTRDPWAWLWLLVLRGRAATTTPPPPPPPIF